MLQENFLLDSADQQQYSHSLLCPPEAIDERYDTPRQALNPELPLQTQCYPIGRGIIPCFACTRSEIPKGTSLAPFGNEILLSCSGINHSEQFSTLG